jgi:hypothetical protein
MQSTQNPELQGLNAPVGERTAEATHPKAAVPDLTLAGPSSPTRNAVGSNLLDLLVLVAIGMNCLLTSSARLTT